MIRPGVYVNMLKEKETELGFGDPGLGLSQELPSPSLRELSHSLMFQNYYFCLAVCFKKREQYAKHYCSNMFFNKEKL